MAGIYIEGGSDIFIDNCTFERCDIAIDARNTKNLRVNQAHINDCEKGVKLDDCWDSEINDIYIDKKAYKYSKGINNFRLTKLTTMVRFYMRAA